MRKVTLSIVVVLLLIGINFILRYVHIRGINDTIEIISNKLSENGLKLTYERIRYGNLVFWKVEGQVINPVLLQEKYEYSDKSSFDYIAFSSILTDKRIIIKLSDKIDTLINDHDGEHKYTSTFTTNPQVDIKFNGYFMTYNKFLKQNELRQYFIKYINNIHYHSAGHKATKVNQPTSNDELIYTIGDSDVKIENQKTEEYDDCKIKINLNDGKYYKTSFGEDYFGLLAQTGSSSFILDADLLLNFKDESKIALNDNVVLNDIKPTYKLKINNYEVLADPFSFKIEGDAVASKTKILPYFDVGIKVINFDNMLEFYTQFYNTLILKADVMKALSLAQ